MSSDRETELLQLIKARMEKLEQALKHMVWKSHPFSPVRCDGCKEAEELVGHPHDSS